jgi:hypothetical protein
MLVAHHGDASVFETFEWSFGSIPILDGLSDRLHELAQLRWLTL